MEKTNVYSNGPNMSIFEYENVIKNPSEYKFRSFKVSNKVFDRIASSTTRQVDFTTSGETFEVGAAKLVL